MRILGMDIGGTSIKLCITNQIGQIEIFREFPSYAKQGGPSLMNQVMSLIEEYAPVNAIGISTAGQVNRREGFILYANDNIPEYTGTKVKSIIEDHFNVPVLVENDVHAAALGERYFGKAKHLDDFLCLTYGTGIGGAIVIDSSIYGGSKGIAAEFGHIVTHPGGSVCNCGKSGCYEQYASTTALVKKAYDRDNAYNTGRKVFAAYELGKQGIKEIVEEWMVDVAVGLASLVHIFNPSAIVVGGGIMEQQVIVERIQERLQEMIMNSFSDVELIQATLGNKAGALGAVSLHLK